MRSKWMITSVVLFMLVAVSGYAQTARAMRITVPFQFSIHDQVLAAGDRVPNFVEHLGHQLLSSSGL